MESHRISELRAAIDELKALQIPYWEAEKLDRVLVKLQLMLIEEVEKENSQKSS